MASCAGADCSRTPARSSGGRGGMCHSHYRRTRLYGAPDRGKTGTGVARAWLEKHVSEDHGAECVPWPFMTNEGGYGCVQHEGRLQSVSAVVCAARHGPRPSPAHEAAHSCKQRRICCNETHLRWATKKENQADRVAHGTHHRGENSPNAKMTEAQAREALHSEESAPKLAKRFGVSASSIARVRKKISWAWLS